MHFVRKGGCVKQIIIGIVCLVLTACVTIPDSPTPISASQTPLPEDKLAEIQARGTLVIATDASYMPQSQLIEGSEPRQETKCEATQYSANQLEGFDVDVAVEIANYLGVEPCFVTPPWSQLVAGNWGDNWDIHVGSVAITYERMKNLYFSSPYYATPTVLLVHAENITFQRAEDLSGKRIGVCVACTFEAYLDGTLKIPGENIGYRIKDAQIIAYENEDPAIDDLSLGDGLKLDAVITLLPKARTAIAEGKPVRFLEERLIFAYASVTLDRSASRSNYRLWDEINRIIYDLHGSGVLSELSIQYHGEDLTGEAMTYDISQLNQFP
jgi:polar amino acid transport system substrate-binding protein